MASASTWPITIASGRHSVMRISNIKREGARRAGKVPSYTCTSAVNVFMDERSLITVALSRCSEHAKLHKVLVRDE